MADRIAYFLLRVVAGWLLFQAGTLKLLGWWGGMPDGSKLTAWTQVWVGGWIETLAGALVMIGLCTRPAAFLLSGTMAVAYWQFHAPQGAWPAQNGGVPAAILCFVFLAIVGRGAGQWSVDAMLEKRPAESAA